MIHWEKLLRFSFRKLFKVKANMLAKLTRTHVSLARIIWKAMKNKYVYKYGTYQKQPTTKQLKQNTPYTLKLKKTF